MLYNCRKACETCIGLHIGVTQVCANQKELHDTIKFLVETQQYVYDEASVRTTTFKECINHDPLCTQWAMHGECVNDPTKMKQSCPAACRMCR
mmetsp:Transcript_23695/g.33957  ORF Transcript_23695/g.33957 Transcript_23695/m.33957 type:complete len:93 (+) Transcript_23695:66-344(+)